MLGWWQKAILWIKRGDLVPEPWAALTWGQGNDGASLGTAHERVMARGRKVHEWYRTHRVWKAWLSKSLRLATAIAVAVAAVFPAVALADPTRKVANLGYVALAVAGGLYGLDRVFGSSKAWMRYGATQTKIQTLLDIEDLRWERRVATWGGREPSPTEREEAFAHLIELMTEIRRLVDTETDEWADQLGQDLAALQAAAPMTPPQPPPSADDPAAPASGGEQPQPS